MGARRGGRALASARLAAIPALPDPDGHFLAGLLDAEGSFLIGRNNGGRNWQCAMRVSLRRDDAVILAKLHRLTGLGTLTAVRARANSKPQVAWTVTSGLECLRLCELLEAYPMYGRKRHEAADWIAAVRAIDRSGSSSDEVAHHARRIRLRRR